MSVARANVGFGLLLVFGLLLAAPIVAHADQGSEARAGDLPAVDTRTFGTALVSHTLQAFTFGGLDATDYAAFAGNALGSRFCTAPCNAEAGLQLPDGARVERIELAACDTNPTGSVTATLFRIPNPEAGTVILASVTTGHAATNGCTFPGQTLVSPHTIDGFNNTYVVQVTLTGNSSATRFQAVRVLYKLQVSPAPAVATFNDVPLGHPFFQVVEALVKAGITIGCNTSPPLFCPDDPVTRKQMAAFISRALGLQFGP